MALWWPLLVLAAAYALCRILLFLIPPTVPSIDVDASDVYAPLQIPPRKGKRAQTDKVQCYEPATTKYLGYFPALTPDEVKEHVAQARKAQKIWAKSSSKQRCQISSRDTGKTMVDASLGEILTTCEKSPGFWMRVKGKTIAARRSAVKTIIFPAANKRDFDELAPNMESSSKPLLLVFKFAEGNDNEPPTLMDPFSQHNSNTNNPSAWRHQMLELKGKQCLACLQGQWLLMLDAASSNHCFLVSPLDDMTIISLPPLDTPLEPLRRCAISSSPLSPDCTIVFSTFMDTYLAYTRPGEDDWWQLDTDDDDDDELLLMGDIVSCQGKMYVPTDMSSIAMLDVSSYPPHIERRGIPEPSCIHSMANAMLVESQGEVFLLRHYGYGARDSELLDIDLHRLVHATDDGGDYVWRKVDTIGDRAIFVADDCVVMSDATKAGIRPDCVYLLHQRCRHGVRLYTIRLDDRTTTFTLLPDLTSNDSIYWLLPAPISSIVDDTTQHYSGAIVHSSSKIDQENGDGISVVDIASEQASPCWCGLPTDMVEEIVSKISTTSICDKSARDGAPS
uniref:DUF295 domain-containing protein n=1 Tax=Oryza barthii TaxID=65489 RepID=A0A0D3GV83_9ORYZ